MSESLSLKNTDILAILQELNTYIKQPLWLSEGVAVDFLVGQWTRPHGDVDLNTFTEFRDELAQELRQIGYRTSDRGWLTHWFQEGSAHRLEIVFLERGTDGTTRLHIKDDDSVGVPGLYPLLPGYLDPNRFATLESVRFRVCSPAGEWLARASRMDVIGGRARDPKLEYDQKLLETIIPEEELVSLRSRERTPLGNIQ